MLFADAICCIHELPTYRAEAKMNCTLCTTDIHLNGRSIMGIKFVMLVHDVVRTAASCEQQPRNDFDTFTVKIVGLVADVRKAERKGYNTAEEARHKKSWKETSGCEVSPKWPAKMKTEAARCKIDEVITKPHAKHTSHLLFFPLILDARWQSLSRGIIRFRALGTGASAELGLLYCNT